MAKKEIKPIKLTVDITDAENAVDVYYAFAVAKIDNELTPNETFALESGNEEFEQEVIKILHETSDAIREDMNQIRKEMEPKKKPGILKRFWNWITGK